MKKRLLVIFIAVLISLSACTLYIERPMTEQGEEVMENSDSRIEKAENSMVENKEEMMKDEVVVDMTSAGFSPNLINVKAGDNVRFENKNTENHWPASAVHPTHQELPGFDALGPVAPGESYEFTFTKVGEWRYHDHLNPTIFGKVVVN